MNTNLPRPRLDKVGIVALVPDYWDPHWQPRHHVLSRLAGYFQVVWMNRPLGWRESLSALRQPRVASTDDPPTPSGMQSSSARSAQRVAPAASALLPRRSSFPPSKP